MKEFQPLETVSQDEVVIYQPSENIILEVRVAENTVWLSQAQMSMLFAVKENTITYHIKEIYKVRELSPNSTTRKIRVVRQEGNRLFQRLGQEIVFGITD